jgi:hypothetical protein
MAVLPIFPSSTLIFSSGPSHHSFTLTVYLPKASRRLLGSVIISVGGKFRHREGLPQHIIDPLSHVKMTRSVLYPSS